MPVQAWVCRDPARQEEFLALLRAAPRSTYLELARKMEVSRFAITKLVELFEREGIVRSELDESRRSSPNAGVPRVAWLAGPSIAPPKILRGAYRARRFVPRLAAVSDWPYAHTGTSVGLAGPVQLFAIQGKQLAPDGRRG